MIYEIFYSISSPIIDLQCQVSTKLQIEMKRDSLISWYSYGSINTTKNIKHVPITSGTCSMKQRLVKSKTKTTFFPNIVSNVLLLVPTAVLPRNSASKRRNTKLQKSYIYIYSFLFEKINIYTSTIPLMMQ